MHWKGEMWTKGQKCEPFLYYLVFSFLSSNSPVVLVVCRRHTLLGGEGSVVLSLDCQRWPRTPSLITVLSLGLFLWMLASGYSSKPMQSQCSECGPKKTRISCTNEIAPQIDLVGMSCHWLSIVSRPLSGWCDWHISWLILCFPDSIQKNDQHRPVTPWNALTGPKTARALRQGTGPGEFWSLIIILYTTRTGTMTDKLHSPVTSEKPSLPSCIQLPNIANVHAGI